MRITVPAMSFVVQETFAASSGRFTQRAMLLLGWSQAERVQPYGAAIEPQGVIMF